MQRKKETLKAVGETAKVIDNEFNALILLEPTSKFELKARVSTLECHDLISKKDVKIKFSKHSPLFKLLSGYSMLTLLYRKSRIIAVEIDLKGNAVVLEDKKLKAVEKKYKKLLGSWQMVHKNSFGIN